MKPMLERGRLAPFTLRFLDAGLEESFQLSEGAAGLGGYRIITAATFALWGLAAVLVPMGTDISPQISILVGLGMSLLGLSCFLASRLANTMNRQHGIASLLTSANGIVILILAVAGDVVSGFAVSGILVLYMFGFVSRTRFVFALVRTAVIAIGFVVVWVTYRGDSALILDAFFLAAASLGSLLGLRLIERDRRRVWHQRLVIEEQTDAIELERSESERLLLNVLPESVSKRLRRGENPIADAFPEVTVLFADIVGFTAMAAEMTADEVILTLNRLFNTFDDLVVDRGLEKIKTIGDAYMVVGGLPDPMPDHAIKVMDLAMAMIESTSPQSHFPGLRVRVGIHSGPVIGGVIGTRKFAYDVWGNTVNMASRLQSTGIPQRIHVSQETQELTRHVFEFEPREHIELRGVGIRTTYLLRDRIEPGPADLAGQIPQSSV